MASLLFLILTLLSKPLFYQYKYHLSILFIFLRLFVSLIITIAFLFTISLISALILMILFILLYLALVCSHLFSVSEDIFIDSESLLLFLICIFTVINFSMSTASTTIPKFLHGVFSFHFTGFSNGL